MPRIVADIATIADHIRAMMETPDRYRPEKCPKCGLAGLWVLGTYNRQAGRGLDCCHRSGIEVPRFICGKKGGCGKSCSRLPSCLPPRRWYLFSIQQSVLALLLADVSLKKCADTVGTIWGPARSTMRRWWSGLRERHDQFSFHLLTEKSDWGRAASWQEFWLRAFSCEPLRELMATLDRRGLTVP
jgi:hypothetical protein